MRSLLSCLRTCRRNTMSQTSTRQFSSRGPQSSIHVLGTGNLGKFVAHAVAKHSPESPVTLLFHRPGLASAWESGRRGIECVSDGVVDRRTNFNVELLPPVSTDPRHAQSLAKPIEYLIVATKTYATTAALSLVKHRLDSTSSILFLQNGMGTTDEVSTVHFQDPKSRPTYLAGICTFGVYGTSPFSIVHAGRGSMTLGLASENVEPGSETADALAIEKNHMVQQLLDAKEALGTTVTNRRELRQAQLLKLVVNAIINPLTVIFNCKNGQLIDEPPRVTLMKLLATETGTVVRALLQASRQDITCFSDDKLVDLVMTVAEKTGQNTSSMLQDIQAGRQTEVDYINGYLTTQAKRLGLPCPNNTALTEMVKQRHVIDNGSMHRYFT